MSGLSITLTHMICTEYYCCVYIYHIPHTRPRDPRNLPTLTTFHGSCPTDQRARRNDEGCGLRTAFSQMNRLCLLGTPILILQVVNTYVLLMSTYFFTAWHLLPTFEEGNAMCPMRDEGSVIPPRLFEQPVWEISGE